MVDWSGVRNPADIVFLFERSGIRLNPDRISVNVEHDIVDQFGGRHTALGPVPSAPIIRDIQVTVEAEFRMNENAFENFAAIQTDRIIMIDTQENRSVLHVTDLQWEHMFADDNYSMVVSGISGEYHAPEQEEEKQKELDQILEIEETHVVRRTRLHWDL